MALFNATRAGLEDELRALTKEQQQNQEQIQRDGLLRDLTVAQSSLATLTKAAGGQNADGAKAIEATIKELQGKLSAALKKGKAKRRAKKAKASGSQDLSS